MSFAIGSDDNKNELVTKKVVLKRIKDIKSKSNEIETTFSKLNSEIDKFIKNLEKSKSSEGYF